MSSSTATAAPTAGAPALAGAGAEAVAVAVAVAVAEAEAEAVAEFQIWAETHQGIGNSILCSLDFRPFGPARFEGFRWGRFASADPSQETIACRQPLGPRTQGPEGLWGASP